MSQAPVLTSLGICCALGMTAAEVWQQASKGSRSGMRWRSDLLTAGQAVVVGDVAAELVDLSGWPIPEHSRNNQLAATAYAQIAADVAKAIQRFGADRIAVVIGTSTSGIASGEAAMVPKLQQNEWPETFDYRQQEMAAPALFIAQLAQVRGPAMAVSTACSSSARALMTARNFLDTGLADAVIVGGVDSLCRMTLRGFSALESVSAGYCQPFAKDRDGINIGEAAALFLLQRQPLPHASVVIRLSGCGASADAHHMSAPHPQGEGAERAIRQALQQADIDVQALSYINAHGTATLLNDAMEAMTLSRVGASGVPLSSSKALTGHTLGAAGALEAALCWLMLSEHNVEQALIPQIFATEPDPLLPALTFAKGVSAMPLRHCLSTSFAFGGNNMAIILSKD